MKCSLFVKTSLVRVPFFSLITFIELRANIRLDLGEAVVKMQNRFGLGLLACAAALGNTLVVPNNNVGAAGNAAADLPTTSLSIEFQQLLGAGQFHSSP